MPSKTRPAVEKEPTTGRFLPGNSGGGGRPKGARNILGEAFLTALQVDFAEHGVAAIQAVRADKPDQYLKVIASLMPKELNVNVNELDNLSDDQLIARIRNLDSAIRPFLDAEGASGASRRATAQAIN